MSGTSWLVLAIVPGVDRRPLQKLPVDESRLFKQLEIWREEAGKVGKVVQRIVVAFEAGRDGCWLARWLQARGVEGSVSLPAARFRPPSQGAPRSLHSYRIKGICVDVRCASRSYKMQAIDHQTSLAGCSIHQFL